jgi:hypothetical protein
MPSESISSVGLACKACGSIPYLTYYTEGPNEWDEIVISRGFQLNIPKLSDKEWEEGVEFMDKSTTWYKFLCQCEESRPSSPAKALEEWKARCPVQEQQDGTDFC